MPHTPRNRTSALGSLPVALGTRHRGGSLYYSMGFQDIECAFIEGQNNCIRYVKFYPRRFWATATVLSLSKGSGSFLTTTGAVRDARKCLRASWVAWRTPDYPLLPRTAWQSRLASPQEATKRSGSRNRFPVSHRRLAVPSKKKNIFQVSTLTNFIFRSTCTR